MSAIRILMASEEYDKALVEFEKIDQSESDVLFLLERGLLLHYVGRYQESNDIFDRAEILSEDLYTKSVSREAAALVTSDLALEYVPKSFEQVLINYFRALNYMFLGEKEDAIVECRKASDKLALYSEEDKRPYRRDAFIEYLTGILYEWDGEINDALISYRNALGGYEVYGELFGLSDPDHLTCDLLRTAGALGFIDDIERVSPEDRKRCGPESQVDSLAKVVVFVEQGFVPPKQELSANIPILKSEARRVQDDRHGFSVGAYSRLYGHSFDVDDIAYFLRVAVPRYAEQRTRPPAPMLFLDDLSIRPAISEDIFALAKAELDHDMPMIFAKTLVRALIKYKASDVAEDKWGKLAGRLVNVATAATERADLRGWLSLPRAIYVAILYVDPGTYSLSVSAPGSEIAGYEYQSVELTARRGSTNFLRFRTY
ncbi:MAG: hypothetical protein ABIJ00_00900 [Candidatus Eisenbacteria bacterium]